MQVDQVTYGSVKRHRMNGYQIIGKSEGVDLTMSSTFCQWAPSHNSLEVGQGHAALDAWGLSYFPLSEFHFVVGRSVHGGPEYSGRGGLSVVTSALVISRKHLMGFEFHAIELMRTALALGYLILPIDHDESLPQAALPRRPLQLPPPKSDFIDSTPAKLPDHAVQWIAREICSLVRDGRKVMVAGHSDPLPILTQMMDQMTPTERSEASFACGLKMSSRRDFRIQFTQEKLSTRLHKELERSSIVPIDVARVLVDSNPVSIH
ncbi:hypothetical protein NHH03_23150 [Stieleria sp. TO1_6]|uniref:GAP1-N2 domain-containing protein n=1 Tax=Stieleria tagensis TaxID=2956795 RepID=UPI0021BC5EDE|nr:hypothetical protein [Stieleria tagensis]MCO8124655.1 hypothetical protein [Stieleria tagensis]